MSPFHLTDAEFEDAVSVLKNLIRIDTSNPPGNELAAAAYLADLLKRAKMCRYKRLPPLSLCAGLVCV